MGVECPKCKTENTSDSEFCKKCATPLPSSKKIIAAPTKTLETPLKELTRGTTFAGRYEFIEELGRGGMGRVYKVFDKKIKEEVAIKILNPEIASDETTIERFSNELKLARKIVHKNVGRMYELMEDEGTHYITMEYVPGEDLKRFIRRSGQLTVGKAVSIAKQVCEGLAEAHKLGVIHRDLKPGNIMIDTDGNARIMDFGIARSLKSKGVTGAGFVVGTPEYMSPEQVEGKEVDKRSDIYSFGVIIFEMLTGRVPFEGDTPFSVAFKHKSEPPPDPRELNAQIPDDLCDVILKCMEKDKGKRYQRTGELISDLAIIDEEIPTTERVLTKKKIGVKKKKKLSFGLRKIFIPVLSIVFLATVAFVALKLVRKPAPELTPESISVMVVDFENRTGDQSFKGVLEQALCSELGEAPFISRIFSPPQARQIANQLDPEAKGELSSGLIQRISEREEIDVVISGLILREGGGYSIKVSASDIASSEIVVEASEQMETKADWERSVRNLAENLQSNLRGQLFQTSSLEAMNAYAKAEEYRATGEMEKAIKEYQRAIKKDPEHAQSYISLSMIFYQRGQHKEAKEHFREAYNRKNQLSGRDKHKTFGSYYLVEHDFPKAIQEFSALIRKYPADPVGYANLALAYFFARDYENALKITRQWIDVNPKDKFPQYNLTWYALMSGKFNLAEEEAQKLLNLSPEFVEAYVCLALSQLAQEKNAKAEEAYQHLRESSLYGASLATIGLADLALYEGRLNDAKDILEKGIDEDINEGDNDFITYKQVILSHAFLQLRQENLALDSLDAAKSAMGASKDAGLLYMAALAYLNAGQEDRALALASQLKKRAPETSAYAMLIEGESRIVSKVRTKEALRKDLPEAIQIFKEANRIDDTWLGHFALGRAYLAAEEFVKAQREFDLCLERQAETTSLFLDDLPTYRYFPPLYLYLGLCQQSKSNPDALESYQKFLDIKRKGEDDALVEIAKQRSDSLIRLARKTEKGVLEIEPRSLLVTNFQNQTGDPIFDGVLEKTLDISLADASFIHIHNRQEALRLASELDPLAGETLNKELAQLVSRRAGVNVVVGGSIEQSDKGYTVNVWALDTVKSETVYEDSTTIGTKSEILKAADRFSAKLRSNLGDISADSVEALTKETFTTTSLEAVKAYALAQELDDQGKSEEALNEYLRAIDHDPNFGRAYSGVALIYFNSGRYEEAETYFQEALKRIDQMTEREKYRDRGLWALYKRDYKKAIDEYSALLEQYPGDYVIHAMLAVAYFYARDMPKAVEQGRLDVKYNPQGVWSRYNLSWYALGAGDLETAEEESRKALELEPGFEKAYITLALTQLAKGELEQASETYRQLKDLGSYGVTLAAAGLADLAVYEGRLAEAVEILEEGISFDLENKQGYDAAEKCIMLAQAYLLQEKKELAFKAADRAVGIRDNAEIVFSAALVYLKVGQLEKARRLQAELFKKPQLEPRVYAKLIGGEMSRARGDIGNAVNLFHEAKDSIIDTWIGHFYLGLAYMDAEDYTAAYSEFETCLKRGGEAASIFFNDLPTFYYFSPVYYYLGRAQEGMGSDAASDSYREYLKIKKKSDGSDPMVADAKKRLAGLKGQ